MREIYFMCDFKLCVVHLLNNNATTELELLYCKKATTALPVCQIVCVVLWCAECTAVSSSWCENVEKIKDWGVCVCACGLPLRYEMSRVRRHDQRSLSYRQQSAENVQRAASRIQNGLRSTDAA